MRTIDRRMLGHMQSNGLLDTQSYALVVDLLQQGCTLEQALLGTRFIQKSEFIDGLTAVGVSPEEYVMGDQRKVPATKLRSLNTEIEELLRTANDRDAYEIVFIPTQQTVRIVYGESHEVTELPMTIYPALVMRLRRWSNRLGWEVRDFSTHAHNGIRLIRAQKRSASHPVEQSEAINALKTGVAGLYVFIQPDAYISEHYLTKSIDGRNIFQKTEDDLSREDALHEALFGGTVLVSVTSAKPAWWQVLDDTDIPVYLHNTIWKNPS
ncbi:MAG: hypothetical protein H6759_01735 [Candidatus Nomurabacteria bacterium]|nr:MAG: hypothetical protein H6759_01735 [Candidatus Nomurabacteria bacterium]